MGWAKNGGCQHPEAEGHQIGTYTHTHTLYVYDTVPMLSQVKISQFKFCYILRLF